MRKRVDPGGVHRESDGFWSKVLVSTIVTIWVGLVAGQWGARWAIEHGKFAARGSNGHQEVAMEQRPDYEPPAPATVDVPTAAASDSPEASDSPLDSQSEEPRATVTVLPPSDSPSDVPTDAVSDVPSPETAASDCPSPLDSMTPSPESSATETPVMPSTPSAAPSSGTRPYTLQIGVYANRANAEKMADDLRSKGYSVEVDPEASGSASTWAVHVGHFPSRDAATTEQDKLQSQGVSSLPVQR